MKKLGQVFNQDCRLHIEEIITPHLLSEDWADLSLLVDFLLLLDWVLLDLIGGSGRVGSDDSTSICKQNQDYTENDALSTIALDCKIEMILMVSQNVFKCWYHFEDEIHHHIKNGSRFFTFWQDASIGTIPKTTIWWGIQTDRKPPGNSKSMWTLCNLLVTM